MKQWAFTLIICLSAASLRAYGPDYLDDNQPPGDQAATLPTPFTPELVAGPEMKFFTSTNLAACPFIRDAAFNLNPELYYRSVWNGAGHNEMFAGGGSLGFDTGWWGDTLQLGTAGYTSLPIASNQTGKDSTGLVAADGNGLVTLGEAWAKLKIGPATATVFRQRLDLPFIHDENIRIIPQTFEAYQVQVAATDNWQFNLGYVSRIKELNDENFIPMSAAAGAPQVDRGTSFAGFTLGSEKTTYLAAIDETTLDLFNSAYVQAGHTWSVTTNLDLRGDLQFCDQRSVGAQDIGDFETQMYGAQLAASCSGAVLSAAYTQTADSASIASPYGSSPSFSGLMINDFDLAGERAGSVGLSYNFARVGLDGVSAFSNCSYGNLPDGWQREFNATIDYRIKHGIFKNLWFRTRYAQVDQSGQTTMNDFRIIVNYTATF